MTASPAQLARRFLYLRLLRASLVLGALSDLAVAALLAVAPARLAAGLGVLAPASPDYPLFTAFAALLLTLLAGLLLLAARDPRRYSAVIAAAVAGRLAAAALLVALYAGIAVNTLSTPNLYGTLGPAAAQAGLGLAHVLLWRPVYS